DGVEHPIGPMTSGILAGIDNGYFSSEIAESAFQYQQALEKGDKKIVGVNCHTSTVSGGLDSLKVSHEDEHKQKRVRADRRDRRVAAAVERTLARLSEGTRDPEAKLVPPIIEAARAEATRGEICAAMGEEFATYTEVPQF